MPSACPSDAVEPLRSCGRTTGLPPLWRFTERVVTQAKNGARRACHSWGVNEGFEAFGHWFSPRVLAWRQELRDLERESAIYSEFGLDEANGGPGLYRVGLSPAETYRYVRGLVGWDEFLYGGFDAVSDRELALDAEANGRERPDADGPCAADFLGDDVEVLVCGMAPHRATRVRPDGSPRDVQVVLHQLADSLPVSLKALTDRGARTAYVIASERDLQDVVYFFLRNLYEDVRREEWVPSSAGDAKRIDLLIPSTETVIELKIVRDRPHAKKIANELRVDLESYHLHPACRNFFGLVWDPTREIADPRQLERDLSGTRVKDDHSFDASIRVI